MHIDVVQLHIVIALGVVALAARAADREKRPPSSGSPAPLTRFSPVRLLVPPRGRHEVQSTTPFRSISIIRLLAPVLTFGMVARGEAVALARQDRDQGDLCDRIAIMDEGEVVASGNLAELLAHSRATEVIELRLQAAPATITPVEAVEGVQKVETVGNEIRIFTARAQHALPRIYRALTGLGHRILRTRVTPVTLDDVFLELTGKELRD